MNKQDAAENVDIGRGRRWWYDARIGYLLTVLTCVAAVAYTYGTREEKVPLWCGESTSLVARSGDGIPGMVIHYKGRQVSQLTSSSVCLWNAGKRTIEGDDAAKSDVLRIVAPPGVAILNAKVLRASREAVQPRVVVLGPSCVRLDFDFLDQRDGFSVQLLHTGSPRTTLRVRGTVRGARPLAQGSVAPYVISFIDVFYFFTGLAGVCGYSVIIRRDSMLSDLWKPSDRADAVKAWVCVVMLIISVIFVALTGFIFWGTYVQHNLAVPFGLR